MTTDPILDLVLLRIRLYARRRIAWLRKTWQEEGNPGGPLTVTHAEIDACLDDIDSPGAEKQWYHSDEQIIRLNQEIKETEDLMLSDETSRFSLLHKIFRISREESDIFQLCLALKLDPGLSRLYAYLHDHAGRGYASEELALRLFGYGRSSIRRADSSLAKWELVHEKETGTNDPVMLSCDRFIFQWILGQDLADDLLVPVSRYYSNRPPLENWPVDRTVALLERIVNNGTGLARVNITGLEGSGRRTLASTLCACFDMSLLAVRVDPGENWSSIFMRAQRQAILENCGIAWYGEAVHELTWPNTLTCTPLQFVICETGQKPKASEGIHDLFVEIPALIYSEQQELIQRFIPASDAWDKEQLDILLSQHRLTIGDITAMSERDVQNLDEAKESLSASTRNRLGSLAQLLECPFGQDDLVISGFLRESLADFIYEARERKRFWENERARNLFPQGRGLIGLFSGPPGTGKTMAAQVIAARLGLELYRIDLSAVVSKYVGETSQNLERILSRAANLDIVLLFDEADALFGKRTEVKDAHDRFANTDTSHLLQAIENYRGIAILATNRKENIDHAFIRRLRYVLDFPKPDAHHRKEIWTKVLDKLLTNEQQPSLNGQLNVLTQVELTGSQIKYALLSAVFSAGRDKKNLGMTHLIRGIDRELMKEGRTLSTREREKLMEHAE
ncbi:MAG: AAA family ATPase [bacterium]